MSKIKLRVRSKREQLAYLEGFTAAMRISRKRPNYVDVYLETASASLEELRVKRDRARSSKHGRKLQSVESTRQT